MMRVPRVNLLPRETLVARRRRAWVRRWAIGVAGSVAVVLVGAAFSALPDMAGHDAIERRFDRVRVQIRELDAELPGARREQEEARRRLLAAERVVLRPDWGALLAYLDRLRGGDVVLERVSITRAAGGGVVLRITGLSGEQGREGALVLGLERSGLFEETTLVKTERVNLEGGERISFEVRGVFTRGDGEVAEAGTP